MSHESYFKHKPEAEDFVPVSILIFRNGDEYDPGTKVAVTRNRFPHWIHLLDHLTTRLQLNEGPVHHVYDLYQNEILHFKELENDGVYVAANKKFKRVKYNSKSHPQKRYDSKLTSLPAMKEPAGISSRESYEIYLKGRKFQPSRLRDMWDDDMGKRSKHVSPMSSHTNSPHVLKNKLPIINQHAIRSQSEPRTVRSTGASPMLIPHNQLNKRNAFADEKHDKQKVNRSLEHNDNKKPPLDKSNSMRKIKVLKEANVQTEERADDKTTRKLQSDHKRLVPMRKDRPTSRMVVELSAEDSNGFVDEATFVEWDSEVDEVEKDASTQTGIERATNTSASFVKQQFAVKNGKSVQTTQNNKNSTEMKDAPQWAQKLHNDVKALSNKVDKIKV